MVILASPRVLLSTEGSPGRYVYGHRAAAPPPPSSSPRRCRPGRRGPTAGVAAGVPGRTQAGGLATGCPATDCAPPGEPAAAENGTAPPLAGGSSWPALAWSPLHAADSSCRAAAASGRAAGSRFISAVITGLSGPAEAGDGGSPCTMLARTAIALPWPSKGPWPSTAAYSVAPSDHRSEAGLAGAPRIRSGEQNPGVPMTMPAWV